MARATAKAVKSATATMEAERLRPYQEHKTKPGEEWRKQPAYMLHPNSGALVHYPTHVQGTVFIMGYSYEEHWPYFVQTHDDVKRIRDERPEVWDKWCKAIHCQGAIPASELTIGEAFNRINAIAERPEWAWGQEATRNTEVGKRRQKALAVREYHIDQGACLRVGSDEKTTKQVKQLCVILTQIQSPILEATLMAELKKAAESGKLVTKQDPWRIFQYYRAQLISLGVIKMKGK